MVRTIANGYGIDISGSVYNAPYIDTTRASAGMVRYLHKNLEVYDGSNWLPLQSSYPTVQLDIKTQEILEWAQNQMIQQQRMQVLADQHPAVADAVAARDRADEAVRIAVVLCDVK